jgi:hypothetical protein
MYGLDRNAWKIRQTFTIEVAGFMGACSSLDPSLIKGYPHFKHFEKSGKARSAYNI